jgi:hypothetical protein
MIGNKQLAFAVGYIPERKESTTCYSYKEIDDINRLFINVAWKYAYTNKTIDPANSSDTSRFKK